jgi:hypothetical protein
MKTKCLLAVLMVSGFALAAQPVLADDDYHGGGPPYTDAFPHVYTVSESDYVHRGASDEVFLYASCDLGDVAISGGYSIGGEATGSGFSFRQEVTIVVTVLATLLQDPELNPDVPPDSWFVQAISSPNFPEDTAAWTLHVSVNCVRNRHPRHGQR